MNHWRIGGERGVVKWGYHVAATVRGWALSDDKQTISGALEEANAITCEETPLAFVVDVGQTQWRWPIRDLTITGTTVTLTVGPKESGHGQQLVCEAGNGAARSPGRAVD